MEQPFTFGSFRFVYKEDRWVKNSSNPANAAASPGTIQSTSGTSRLTCRDAVTASQSMDDEDAGEALDEDDEDDEDDEEDEDGALAQDVGTALHHG